MAERTSHRLTTLLLLGVFVLFCLAFLSLSVREALAAHAARQGTIRGFERSVRLSTDNAATHAQYGIALLFSGDWKGAKTQLEAATTLNPGEPQYWLDLARIDQVTGDTARAIERARNTGGSYGWVLWESGLLYLGQNEPANALRVFRQALQSDVLPADRVIDISWRTTRNPELILDSLMTGKPQPYSVLLGTLIREGQIASADMVWKHLLQRGKGFPPDLSFGYVDSLIRQGRIEDASRAWRDFAQISPALLPYKNGSNLIANGGFELPLLNGGFEWKYTTASSAAVSLDAERVHSGQRSLKLDFQAEELWDGPILQNVCVRPDTQYRFSGFVSSQDLWTLSGPRLRIQDALSGTRFALSDEFTGSTPWRRVEQAFTTGHNTRLVTLSLVRVSGNSSIHGSLWLDELSLAEVRR